MPKTIEAPKAEMTVDMVKNKVTNAMLEVHGITVKTEADMIRAAEVLTNVKKLGKFVTQEKEKITKPMSESLKAAKALFAPLEDDLDQAETTLKRAILAYQRDVEAERARKEASIAQRAEKGQLRPETAVKKMEELGEAQNKVNTGSGSIAFSKIKKVRVTDEAKVPDRFWTLDMVAIRKEALAAGVIGEAFPGIEVYEETNMSANG